MAASSALSLEGLKAALEANPLSTATSAAGLGALFHLSVLRTADLDNNLYEFLAVSLVSFGGLASAYLTITHLSVLSALARIALVTTSFNAGILLSIAIYRLFFHRLRKFPGPVGAKLTRFYAVSQAAKDVQYHKVIAKLHEEYGDFVRTGPRELSIRRKSAVPLIYGPNSDCRKATWYMQSSIDCTNSSIHMTRDYEDHKRRRKAWDRGFAIKALNTYEPRIKKKADQFMDQIASHAESDKPLDGTAWSMYFSFDIMGEVGFGKDFGGIVSGTEHPIIKGIHDHMGILGVMANIPWLLNLVSHIPGAAAPFTDFFGWCSREVKSKEKQWNPDQYPQDLISWLLKAFVEKDVSAPPSEEALHEDSRVIIIAGSETTATTLATVLFYFAKYPAVFKKLQSLVDAAMPNGAQDWSYEKAKSITFIDDIVNETLRLKPAVMTGAYRVTPARGLQIDEVFIPGNTNVIVPTQVVQTDARYWKQGEEFIPERFGERRTELETDGAPWIPFNIGAYSCPGKNLAMMSLRISISKIAQQFDVSFAPGETGEKFDKEALDTFTTTLPPVMLQFSKRQ